MLLGQDWFSAFPIRPASEAVAALCDSWAFLASKHRSHFNHSTREPHLTRALKAHVEAVTARQRGLLGMWATESVQNEVDFETAKIVDERRTDIVYGWNDHETSVQLVFEFKKLNKSSKARTHYLGADGLGRFVTGTYSRGQSIAAMVGILVDPEAEVVPPLQAALASTAAMTSLQICPTSAGNMFELPSALFSTAAFDTEHTRAADLAPPHGTIKVAHFFLKFAYIKQL